MKQIKGLDSLIKKLDAMGGKTLGALERAVKTTTQSTADDAKRFSSYGSVRSSIQNKVDVKGNAIEG